MSSAQGAADPDGPNYGGGRPWPPPPRLRRSAEATSREGGRAGLRRAQGKSRARGIAPLVLRKRLAIAGLAALRILIDLGAAQENDAVSSVCLDEMAHEVTRCRLVLDGDAGDRHLVRGRLMKEDQGKAGLVATRHGGLAEGIDEHEQAIAVVRADGRGELVAASLSTRRRNQQVVPRLADCLLAGQAPECCNPFEVSECVGLNLDVPERLD